VLQVVCVYVSPCETMLQCVAVCCNELQCTKKGQKEEDGWQEKVREGGGEYRGRKRKTKKNTTNN